MKKIKEYYVWNGHQLIIVDKKGFRVLTDNLLMPIALANKLSK